MIRQLLPNFLLKYLLKFTLQIYLMFSKLFHVDFQPSRNIDDSYTKLNSLDDPLPIIENLDYQEILAEAKENGNEISPVNRHKSLTVEIEHCPKCNAPTNYLGSYGYNDEGYQKLKCKVCDHQWAPNAPQSPENHPTYRCPYCEYALGKEKQRKNFDKYKCRNDDCPKWQKDNERYRYRAFKFDPENLPNTQFDKKSVNLKNSHYEMFIISKAVDFYIGLGLSLRQTKRAIEQAWNVSVSRETIQNWVLSFAHQMASVIPRLNLPLSGVVAIDETYVKIKGSWHYLFTAIDGDNGFIIAQHLSDHRDAKAAITVLNKVIKQYEGDDFTLVTDMAPVYEVAVHASKIFFDSDIDHKQVKGLFTDDENSDEDYRPYKNTIERFFGTYKAHYKRHKSFSSFDGALAHITLFQLYFNYLKPHSSYQYHAPIVVEGPRGDPIENWAQLLRWIEKQ